MTPQTDPQPTHEHEWMREYAPNYRQASEANDWTETCSCGAIRSGTGRVGSDPYDNPDLRCPTCHHRARIIPEVLGPGRWEPVEQEATTLLPDEARNIEHLTGVLGAINARGGSPPVGAAALLPEPRGAHPASRRITGSQGRQARREPTLDVERLVDVFDWHMDACMRTHRSRATLEACIPRIAAEYARLSEPKP